MSHPIDRALVERLRAAVNRDRLTATAVALVEVPSPTCDAGAVSDRLAGILRDDGFEVERPVGGWPAAPAVATRYRAARPGRTLQFDGHLDTVHLPFVPPRVEGGILFGSGAADMKGGVAAMIEALRILKETDSLPAGEILVTAHDLHEAPWGDGGQLNELIRSGYVGDAVLLPEYSCDSIPVIGRGLAVIEVTISRDGEPVHEVFGGIEQPNVIAAGAEVIRRFGQLDQRLAESRHPEAGRESIFVGRAAGGEIYNQSPTRFELAGTRRWLPGRRHADAKAEIDVILASVAQETGTKVVGTFQVVRDAFEIDRTAPFIAAFQSAHSAVTGKTLPFAAKPFVDDGNSFVALGGVTAITHGPRAVGAHTLYEKVPLDELARVAVVYALTAIAFCPA